MIFKRRKILWSEDANSSETVYGAWKRLFGTELDLKSCGRETVLSDATEYAFEKVTVISVHGSHFIIVSNDA